MTLSRGCRAYHHRRSAADRRDQPPRGLKPGGCRFRREWPVCRPTAITAFCLIPTTQASSAIESALRRPVKRFLDVAASVRSGTLLTKSRSLLGGPARSSENATAHLELDVLVIGAGQAGLATGYHLGRAGLRYELLDANPRVGDSWRRRFDSLHAVHPAVAAARFPGWPSWAIRTDSRARMKSPITSRRMPRTSPYRYASA
ncbi:MAG: NAD(P)-binding protein [Marinilabiliales bacterium]|nr:NAD(P)-binding protein [Marinilabiliales bacterium]